MSGLIFVLLLCVFGELILLLGPGMGVGGVGVATWSQSISGCVLLTR